MCNKYSCIEYLQILNQVIIKKMFHIFPFIMYNDWLSSRENIGGWKSIIISMTDSK